MYYPPTTMKYQTTGAAAIAAAALVPLESGNRELISVTLHFSADPGVEDLTITLNNVNGAAYDSLLKTQAMTGVIDFVWSPSGRIILQPGDSLDVAQTNALTRTYGLEVTVKEVS
ncbi:MAG: hypothetical protein KAT00_03360 [Planctomycetes bacterium]|nr:hypothetical protein [Planctomycetota bacterium]